MPNVGYEYVPLPYKEMLTGNLMRQAAYDKGQETIDNIDSLYNQPVLQEDRDLLENKEEAFNANLSEQIESVGGDLGKLTGFLNSEFRRVSQDPDYSRALQSKAAYDTYYKDLMEADIDPQIKQLKMRQSQVNYLGAENGIFQGTPYINMNQREFDKEMREIAALVKPRKTTRQVPVLVDKDGIKFNRDEKGYFQMIGGKRVDATSANAQWALQPTTVEEIDPREVGVVLNNAVLSNSTYTAYIKDLLQSQTPNRNIEDQDLLNFIYSEEVDPSTQQVTNISGLASVYAQERNQYDRSEGKYDFETDPEETEPTYTTSADMNVYGLGVTPTQTIERKTASQLGGQILEADNQIEELQTRINVNTNAPENEKNTNQIILDDMINERNSLLKQAVNAGVEQINTYAESSLLWADDVFDTNMENYYDNIKNEVKKITGKEPEQEDFTEKAKLLAAIPGIESISLLSDSPETIEALTKLNTANYKLLEKSDANPNGFEKGEDVMPYLQAAQWIANRARRADVVSSYEQSLRSASTELPFVKDQSDALTNMMVSQQLAFTDFYASEDVAATTLEKGVNKELVEVLPTLTMINGSPAYQFNEYEPVKTGQAEINRGKLSKTTFVKGTNSADEAVKYKNLGVYLLKLGSETKDTPGGQAHINDGIQVIANSVILGPMQRTGLETAGMVGEDKDADGFPYMEKKLSGFNVKLRRVDKGGGVAIFELRSEASGAIIGYDDPNSGTRQALVGASLEDLALKYFLLSGESINSSGMTGQQLINSYIKSE